jgi:pimeloyl-ACP methyl ester carboxylesterase
LRRRVFFLPGASGDPDFWLPLGDLLPASWEKVYFAWPGLGNCQHDPTVNGFNDLVSLVEKKLGDVPVDILAQSMGGLVGARIAIRHPANVHRLVFSATTIGGPRAADYGADDWRPDYRRDYPNAEQWISDRKLDITNDPGRITQPTLLLFSDSDQICPLPIGEKLAALIPDARLEVVHGRDHGFVRDYPTDVIEAVRLHLG